VLRTLFRSLKLIGVVAPLAVGAVLAGATLANAAVVVPTLPAPVSLVRAGRVVLPSTIASFVGSEVAVVRTNYVNNTNAAGDTGTLASIPGYDDSTGLGTPDGLSFLSGLAPRSALVIRARQAKQ
jgi:hypothetical protein